MLRTGDHITYRANDEIVRAVVSEVVLDFQDGRQIVRLRLEGDDDGGELEVSTDLLEHLGLQRVEAEHRQARAAG